jgi:8-oxo-dGTP pyrophosphatase MutT (NUDIX family)
MRQQLTLALVHTDTHILLGLKKRGLGEGRWNGFGGKVRTGEAIEDAARRELREECGIEATELEPRGTLVMEYASRADILEIHLFRVGSFTGSPTETEEMRPHWFRLVDIPFDRMWPDDRHWLPLFLAGKKFEGTFYFLDDDTLLNVSLYEEAMQTV